MPIHAADNKHLIATGLYHAMEIAEREAPIYGPPPAETEMAIDGMPADGLYEPAVDFVFKTRGFPSAMFMRRDVEAIHQWLGEWLEANPTPENVRREYTPVWQNTPAAFIR